MAANADLLRKFAYGENIYIEFYGKNPNGSVLGSTARITFTASDTDEGSPLVEEDTGGSHVSLSDAATGFWIINVPKTAYSTLKEGTSYFFNIWSDDGSDFQLQAKGRLRLNPSIERA